MVFLDRFFLLFWIYPIQRCLSCKFDQIIQVTAPVLFPQRSQARRMGRKLPETGPGGIFRDNHNFAAILPPGLRICPQNVSILSQAAYWPGRVGPASEPQEQDYRRGILGSKRNV